MKNAACYNSYQWLSSSMLMKYYRH